MSSLSLLKNLPRVTCLLSRNLSLSSNQRSDNNWLGFKAPTRWSDYNDRIYEPTPPGVPERPAFVCHSKLNVKYSPSKLWYVACLVRGMSVDEAIRQLDYVGMKGGQIVKNTILEAQELAVKEHNVEFKSNLWIAESFSGKGLVVKGMRRHSKKRIGMISYRYAHYFVRLEEGSPPKEYYTHLPPKDGPTLLKNYIQERRELQIS